MNEIESVTRREAARIIAATSAGMMLPMNASGAERTRELEATMLTRPIPATGEKLPVIGLGTWQTFDIGSSDAERKPLEEVLSKFVKLGGRVMDSSPMYGRAEQVAGDIAMKLAIRDSLFLATKVWTSGKEAGVESMERSLARLRTKRIDLMQVHNLVDTATQLATIRERKIQGRVRCIGITHYNSGGFVAVEKILRSENLDFLQINYSIDEREAEQRLLPLAQERRVAAIVNRPFGGGDLFRRLRGKPLPEWAAEFDCTSWAQFLLKWIVAHPAVTCTIPATSNALHLADNMQGGVGRLPDAEMRDRMARFVADLSQV